MSAAADPAPVLPPGTRGVALTAVAIGVVTFGVLALRYRGESHQRWLDGRVLEAVEGAEAGRSLLARAVVFGNPSVVVVLAFLLAGVALLQGRRRMAAVAVLGPGLTGLATTTLKPLVGRTMNGEFAYPSGHTGGATALALVTALLLAGALRSGRRAGTALIVGVPLVAGAVIGLGVTARDWHYATDAVGGVAVAVAVVLGVALVAERVAVRARPGRAVAG